MLAALSATMLIILRSIIKKAEKADTVRNSEDESTRQAIDNLTCFVLELIDGLIGNGSWGEIKDWQTAKPASGGNGDRQKFIQNVQDVADYTCYGIITYLKEHYPELTAEELSVCAMSCLGFSANTARYLMHMGNPSSFYNMRSRIRRKMNCTDSDATLDRHLESITAELKKSFFLTK